MAPLVWVLALHTRVLVTPSYLCIRMIFVPPGSKQAAPLQEPPLLPTSPSFLVCPTRDFEMWLSHPPPYSWDLLTPFYSPILTVPSACNSFLCSINHQWGLLCSLEVGNISVLCSSENPAPPQRPCSRYSWTHMAEADGSRV